MLYANLFFSKILHTLVKVYMDQATVTLVIPKGKKCEEEAKVWGPFLEELRVTKLLLPDVPLYGLDPKEGVLPKPRWRTAMYLVSGKNVSINPTENASEEIKKFVLKHHRGFGQEAMMKNFPDVEESKEENKLETFQFQVEKVVTLSECLFFFRFLSICNAGTWACPKKLQPLIAILQSRDQILQTPVRSIANARWSSFKTPPLYNFL